MRICKTWPESYPFLWIPLEVWEKARACWEVVRLVFNYDTVIVVSSPGENDDQKPGIQQRHLHHSDDSQPGNGNVLILQPSYVLHSSGCVQGVYGWSKISINHWAMRVCSLPTTPTTKDSVVTQWRNRIRGPDTVIVSRWVFCYTTLLLSYSVLMYLFFGPYFIFFPKKSKLVFTIFLSVLSIKQSHQMRDLGGAAHQSAWAQGPPALYTALTTGLGRQAVRTIWNICWKKSIDLQRARRS